MKYAILGDIHFKKLKTELERSYREKVLYFVSKTLEERKIDNVIQLGDFFDDRKNLDVFEFVKTQEYYKKYFGKIDSFLTLTGNHDSYLKNTNDINSTSIFQQLFPNFFCISEIKELPFGLIVPWINESNIEQFNEAIQKKHKYCFGHFEINSFSMVKGFEETHGLSSALFNNCDKVFSGHFHLVQDKNNISYVGSLFQNDRNDINDIKRILILDTDTDEIEEIKIPFELFKRVSINSEDDMTDDLIDSFDEKIVDIVFNVPKSLKREKYMDKIIDAATTFEFNIIDNSELCKEAIDMNVENEEIGEIFTDFLKISDTIDDKRKEALNTVFTDIYKELI